MAVNSFCAVVLSGMVLFCKETILLSLSADDVHGKHWETVDMLIANSTRALRLYDNQHNSCIYKIYKPIVQNIIKCKLSASILNSLHWTIKPKVVFWCTVIIGKGSNDQQIIW